MNALLGLGDLLLVWKCLEVAARDVEAVFVRLRERFGFETGGLAELCLPQPLPDGLDTRTNIELDLLLFLHLIAIEHVFE